MKYFRPDLVAQFASPDEEEADRAADSWEAESAAYAQYLEGHRSQLPPELRRLLDRYYLHDATVELAGQPERDFIIVLTPDAPPRDLLLLRYQLVADPKVIPHPTDRADDAPVEWLYDEVEVHTTKRSLFRRPRRFYRHSILLSNGLELQIEFDDFHLVSEPSPRVPVIRAGGRLISAASS